MSVAPFNLLTGLNLTPSSELAVFEPGTDVFSSLLDSLQVPTGTPARGNASLRSLNSESSEGQTRQSDDTQSLLGAVLLPPSQNLPLAQSVQISGELTFPDGQVEDLPLQAAQGVNPQQPLTGAAPELFETLIKLAPVQGISGGKLQAGLEADQALTPPSKDPAGRILTQTTLSQHTDHLVKSGLVQESSNVLNGVKNAAALTPEAQTSLRPVNTSQATGQEKSSQISSVQNGSQASFISGQTNLQSGSSFSSQSGFAQSGNGQPPALAQTQSNLIAQPTEELDLALNGGEFDDTLDSQLNELQRQVQQRPELTQTQVLRGQSAAQAAQIVSQVGQRLLERFDGQTSRFEIRLDPAELGEVDVRVEVDRDGRVQAVLAARDPAAAEALMRGAKTLEDVLARAGLDLGEEGVQVELENQNQHNAFPGDGKGDDHAVGQDASTETEPELTEAASADPVIQSWSRQRLDVRA